MSVAPPGGQDRIMIYGPKSDGTYIIEFRMADGESLARPESPAYSGISRRVCLRARRAGRFVRNIRCARVFSLMESSQPLW